jgi:hypothetical protein
MSDSARKIADATGWLLFELGQIRFGEVGVRLVIHEGRVVRVERTTTEKAQAPKRPSDSGGA